MLIGKETEEARERHGNIEINKYLSRVIMSRVNNR